MFLFVEQLWSWEQEGGDLHLPLPPNGCAGHSPKQPGALLQRTLLTVNLNLYTHNVVRAHTHTHFLSLSHTHTHTNWFVTCVCAHRNQKLSTGASGVGVRCRAWGVVSTHYLSKFACLHWPPLKHQHTRHMRHMRNTRDTWKTHETQEKHMRDTRHTWDTWETHKTHEKHTRNTWDTCTNTIATNVTELLLYSSCLPE